MTDKEIIEVEVKDNIKVLEDVNGNVINLDTNEEFNDMGKGDEENGKE